MVKNATNPRVDGFISRLKLWRDECERLRKILLGCGLKEEFKWGKPCYTFDASNVVVMQPFKSYCAILFFKGALLRDDAGILVKPGENSQAGRQIRFADAQQIRELQNAVASYIYAAIEVEKSGLKVERKNPAEFLLPEEFQRKLKKMPALKKAFESLTPGRQRAYNLFISAPRQTQTREARIEKCLSRILEGKGLNDR
jgi:uncharacterized protein YdeI (YjbR/CyaY-like superfamily)